MTAAVRAQLLAAGAKIPKEPTGVPHNRTNARHPTKDTDTPRKSIVEPETPEDVTPPPTTPHACHIGRYRLDVANGTHYPGRMRAVLVGPADADLIKCLTAALHQFTKQP